METYRVISSDMFDSKTPSLQHYGVLGMKWGIRRTPEQLGRHRIKKGTTIYRVTSNPNESHTGHAYVSYLKPDRDRYRAWQLYDENRKYEKTYVVTKDLNIPSRSELEDVICYTITKDQSRKFLKEVANLNMQVKSRVDTYMMRLLNAHPKEITGEVMHALDRASGVRSAIFSELKRRGYNAVVDEYDVGGLWGERSGVEPLIVFDRQDTLSEISTKRVDEKEATRSEKRYKRWQATAERHSKNNQW